MGEILEDHIELSKGNFMLPDAFNHSKFLLGASGKS